ncbi:transmembrane protein 72 isoform X2 [Antennarius striatus]
MCAVGIETLHHGEFNSLGVYLLVSSVAIMIFEMAYFLDALLFMCLPCPPDWQLFVLWGKMARVGGFQKFLYYSIMSVICFLHPVLVWHATIPGIMLLVTALFNFILSKKTKVESPKRPKENQGDQDLANTCVTEEASSDSNFSFLLVGRGRGLTSTSRDCCVSSVERGECIQAMLESEQTAAPKGTDRERRRWKERRLIFFRGKEEPMEREMEEMDCYSEPEPDTTADTAPMITD